MKAVILGAGRMGRVHAQAARDLGLAVVGLCDTNSDNLALAQGEAHEAGQGEALTLSDDAEAILTACRPEVVGVATTSPAHARYTHLALDHGARIVVCEKPFASSIDEADGLARRAAEAEARVAVNHQMRFMDAYTKVRALLDSGAFGALTSMNVLGGNFGLATNGSHYFEAFRYLAGEPLATVRASFDADELPNPRGPQFRDVSGVVHGRSGSGVRFSLDASADQGHGMAVHYGTQLGQIYVSEFDGEIHFSHREDAHRDAPTTRYGMPWTRDADRFTPPDNLGPTTAVYRAALAGENYPSAAEGAQVVRALCACHLSHERGGLEVALGDAALDVTQVYPWP